MTQMHATKVKSINPTVNGDIGGRFRWEKWKCQQTEDGQWKPEKLLEASEWHENMITNLGMRGWATRALCENFIIGAIGTGQTRDVRYPTFTLTPGTNITARSGNAVSITGTVDTTLFSAGDILVYNNVCEGQYHIASRVVNGTVIDLVLKNMDGTEPTGTTPANTGFWIYRATQTGLQTEYKRAGRASASGSMAAANSDPATVNGWGFVAADTTGPVTAGSGATGSATLAAGAVSAVSIVSGGSNYLAHSPPTVLLKGGDAGKFITGTITSTSNDSGVIGNGGTGYSNVAGNVTLKITGPGRSATFTCNVTAGVITSIDIGAAGEGYFADAYSTAAGNITIKDSTGTGSGASVTLTPRRQAKAVACVSSGAVSEVVVTYGGYKLLSAPTVTFFSTSYLVHERTWAFTLETGNVSIAEVGVSNDRAAGENLFARMVIRNSITGAIAPVALVNGEQFRLTYQLIQNIAPSVETEVNSALVGGWGLQAGGQRYELIGHSTIISDGRTGWKDNAFHSNEPYFYDGSQMVSNSHNGSAMAGYNQDLKAYISESFEPFAGLGVAVSRGTASVKWSTKGVTAPVITYMESNAAYYPTKIVKKALWSIAAGNDVVSIGSLGLAVLESASGAPLDKIAFTHIFDSAARAQASGSGKPEKLNTHTLELSFEYRINRRFAG